MKKWKKLSSILLVVVMVLAMAVPAMADDNEGSIQLVNTVAGKKYELFRIFDLTYAGEGDAQTVAYTVNEAWAGFFAEGAAGRTYLNTENRTGELATVTFEGVRYYVDVENGTEDGNTIAKFAQDALKYAIQNEVPRVGDVITADSTSYTINNLPLGTYLVYPEEASILLENPDADGIEWASVCSLTSTLPNATISIKATYPTVDKEIDVDNDTDTKNDSTLQNRPADGNIYNTAAIDDVVPYTLPSMVVPSTGAYETYFFILHDKLSKGLEFNEDSVKISIGTGDGATQLVERTHYYIVTGTKEATGYVGETEEGDTFVKIVFMNFKQWGDNAQYIGLPINVSYSATVTDDVELGTDANTNTVYLQYSNNPRVDNDGTPENPNEPDPTKTNPTGNTPEEVTYTFATGIELHKVDGANGAALSGAEFEISGTKLNRVIVSGEYYVADANGAYYLLNDGTYTTTAPGSDSGLVDNNGNTVTIDEAAYKKLSDGSYARYKKETKVTESTEVVELDGAKKITAVVENGVLTFKGLSEGTYTITEIKAPDGYNILLNPIVLVIDYDIALTDAGKVASITWKATKDGTPITVPEGSDSIINADGLIAFDVQNNRGSLLPDTGGIGTTIFYVIGGILVLGAGVMLVTKKRMAGRD